MSNKVFNNKCDECGEAMCPYVYKGRNNTYLCGGTWYNKGCGQNICFICGKKEEEKFRWEEDEDCCGNKKMIKIHIPMFSQFERDENDPDRKLKVLYCTEHEEEALKSPYKWTKEDEEREIQRGKGGKIQKEREKEEKLNNQKNLFFCDGLADAKGEMAREYGAFLGRENGQNYFLMIPFDHPIWEKKTDPAIKKAIENFWWDGNQEDFFIIERAENIPIEKSPPDYWKRLSKKSKPIFHKIVGLNDQITITEAKNLEVTSQIQSKIKSDQTIQKSSFKDIDPKFISPKIDLEKPTGEVGEETKKIEESKKNDEGANLERKRRKSFWNSTITIWDTAIRGYN